MKVFQTVTLLMILITAPHVQTVFFDSHYVNNSALNVAHTPNKGVWL